MPKQPAEPCSECRARKRRCDGTFPECDRYRRYRGSPSRPSSASSRRELALLEQQLGELEDKYSKLMEATEQERKSATPLEPPYGHPPPEMRGEWWKANPMHPAIHSYLIEICFSPRNIKHFSFDPPSFFASLRSPDATVRLHPCLLAAMYLMGCLSTSELPASSPYSLVRHETYFLERARKGMEASLAYSDRLMDHLKASNVVVAYFSLRGRFLEGYHQHCGAARLAISCGLHRIPSGRYQAGWLPSVGEAVYLLDAPRNQEELTDRVMTFWNVYMWDKCGSILTGFASGFDEVADRVITPLPRPIEEYERGDLREADRETILDFLAVRDRKGSRADSDFSTNLKTIATYQRAKNLMSSAGSATPKAEAIGKLHQVVDSLLASLPPVPASNQGFIASAYMFAYAAVLEMTIDVGPGEEMYSKRIQAATHVAAILSGLDDTADARGCVIFGYCWSVTAQTLIQHGHHLKSHASSDVADNERHIGCVVSALERLGVTYPSMEFLVQQLKAMMMTTD
ncbi:hypothetical protein FRB99_004977 [Tulasnella sp. 403]|nr:hypothetical protein FRB99_004977 [Tulasnella sp. 403]